MLKWNAFPSYNEYKNINYLLAEIYKCKIDRNFNENNPYTFI